MAGMWIKKSVKIPLIAPTLGGAGPPLIYIMGGRAPPDLYNGGGGQAPLPPPPPPGSYSYDQ